MSVGKQKEPISMERLMSLINLPIQERSSVSSALLDARSFGVLLSGNALDDRIAWAGGVFNQFIDTDQSVGDAETSVVGRMTWLPYLSENQRHLLHLGAAVRVSNGNDGYSFRSVPEFDKSPVYIDTGLSDADEIRQYNVEASWRSGPFWLHGEYVTAGVDSSADGNLDFDGYHITGSWLVTGEVREYRFKGGTLGPVPVSRSVHENAWGALELAARWSSIDLSDRDIDGGEMQIASAGVNWWLSTTFMINFNYRYIVNDRFNLEGTSSGAMLRVLLKLN
jgi:phosphate-selective porin OprO/OprP